MPSDEEILRERLREWYDRQPEEGLHMPLSPAPIHRPVGTSGGIVPAPGTYVPERGESVSEREFYEKQREERSGLVPPPAEPKQETWRDRAIKEPLL